MPYREDGLAGTTSDVGTGTLTLSATPKSRHHLPSIAGLDPRPYAVIHDGTPNEAERGFAPYNTTTRELLRNDAAARVTRSTNADAKVSFSSGTKSVYFGLAAEEFEKSFVSLSILTSAARTSAFTATAGTLEETDTSGGAFACNLTASPTRGMRNAFIDVSDTWSTNNLTIQRNGSTIEGLAEDIVASGGKLVALYYDGTTWRFEYSGGISPLTALQEVLLVAASDETSGLTTGVSKTKFRMPFAMNLTEVRASVGTAPVGATVIVDINETSGSPVSILGTKLSIDAGEKTSKTAAVPATITDANLADDAEITIDIDQVGSEEPGAGLKVTLIGLRV